MVSFGSNANFIRVFSNKCKVSIFNLAKNTLILLEKIQRFYAEHPPLSAEMARNLLSFGE